ncbi:MAG: protein phosphatase 2C domain-containing protein, partial [Thermodesulfovibrionales bacterium]|nr:protein phosphatase 2C domain-containing protein [Thermodesulfovibrionales bacterium]
MTVFSATYTDIIKFNKKPNEDFFLISKKKPIFTLADGVTQSRFENGKYAYPAGARAAAQIFCNSCVEYIEENFKPHKKIIEEAFDFANQRIWELNKNEGIIEKLDYLIYDYFDTVGVAGFISKKKIFYGYVGDCGLAIFD